MEELEEEVELWKKRFNQEYKRAYEALKEGERKKKNETT